MKLQTKKKWIAKLLVFAILVSACSIGNFDVTAKAADIQNFQITGTYQQTEARTMLAMINNFRTGKDAWQWNENDTEKVPITGLEGLQYDYNLEKIAMQRAMELVAGYSHTRPNGESCFTAYTDEYRARGENIAIGTSNLTAAKVFELWQETDEPYAGQGHRRNMLSNSFHSIGIGHVYYNGCHYWVQEFGDRVVTETFEPANDLETPVTVAISTDQITTLNCTSDIEQYKLNIGDTAVLPVLSLELRTKDTWTYAPAALAIAADSPAWEVNDTTIASISGNNIIAVSSGTTTLAGTLSGKTIEIPITVSPSQTTPDVPPAEEPTADPTAVPTTAPSTAPTTTPTAVPTATPTIAPTETPTAAPTATPTIAPTTAEGIQNFQITGTYQQTEARTMLAMINNFRTGKDACQWNENNTEQVPITGLEGLQYDYNLEKIAMQRAMELVAGYSHTRPNGESCFTAYTDEYRARGENIAIGTSNLTAAKVFELWQETNEPYAGQGHRRNMLSNGYRSIGIGHVYYKGCHYWVQEFGDRVVSETFAPANDSETAVTVAISTNQITTLNYTSDVERYQLNIGNTAALPVLSLELRTKDTWAYAPAVSSVVTDSLAWKIKDTAVANISGSNIIAVSSGTTTLIGIISGKTIEIPITVSPSQTTPDVPPTEVPTTEPTATPTKTPATEPTTVPTEEPTTTPTMEPGFNPVDLSEHTKVTLNKTSYTYNGKAKKPGVTVTAGIKTLTKNTDYTVSYKNNIKVGTSSVVITGTGDYTGSVTLSFKILPKGISTLGKTKAKSKGFTVNWKKQANSTTGYQIQYSTSKKFTGNTTVTKTIGKTSTTKLTISKLKAKKKYYVRIRTYKTVNGKKYYSSWSKTKSVSTKK